MNRKILFIYPAIFITAVNFCLAQSTQVRGFADISTSYNQKKVSFGFGEEDIFINAVLNDRFSFLGETVFKYSPESHSEFAVSIERIIINYNLKGNNNLILGKIHTPLNYWNDTYHHGRVFFPTINRPLLFAAEIIPLHTLGAGVQGHDLGGVKFGYDFFVGNGLGSPEISDNDKRKSITAAIHIKPADRLRIGLSYYNDAIAKGASVHDKTYNWRIRQNLLSASVARFGKKFEMLAEGTLAFNHTDTTGSRTTAASYIYTGYRVTNKLVSYLRFDNLHYQEGEVYYDKDNTTSILAGVRYEINYLAVVKLEYQHQHDEFIRNTNTVTLQFAIGF